ncbi:hypothetical protein [Herbidospora mongoliensis]|uniref:hypothetical protein n=1 Tax=Herbidospora mongoliensis TaxID=688067 RepID=UPI00082F962F|nr:hypothetical protein [Herbidospora mongoliensis]
MAISIEVLTWLAILEHVTTGSEKVPTMTPFHSLTTVGLVSLAISLISYILSIKVGAASAVALMASGGTFLTVATLGMLILEYLRK